QARHRGLAQGHTNVGGQARINRTHWCADLFARVRTDGTTAVQRARSPERHQHLVGDVTALSNTNNHQTRVHTLHNLFSSLRKFSPGPGKSGRLYSLAALEEAGLGRVSRMPPTLRIVLESLLRNCDGKRVTEEHVRNLAAWRPDGARSAEIPFIVVRIVLQDLIGLPSLNDLAAMRAAAQRLGHDPRRIEPLVPVDVVVDHSVEVDVHNAPDALQRNTALEFQRNAERYQFVKWAQQAYSN